MKTYRIAPFLAKEIERLQAIADQAATDAVLLGAPLARLDSARDVVDPLPLPKDGTAQEFLAGILYGGQAIAFETITVTAGAPAKLLQTLDPRIQGKCRIALIVLEADSTTPIPTRAVRFRQDTVAPTATVGHWIGDNGAIEIKNLINLRNVQFIGINAGKTHKLQVQYFA